DEITAFGLTSRVHGAGDEQLAAHQAVVLACGHHRAHNLGNDHLAFAVAFPIGSASSRVACGRGMTCTDPSSPTRRAGAAPASVAAFTAATSPRTMAVTYPAPIFSHPTSGTFAAFTIASAPSIIATSPLVSPIPSASPIDGLQPYRRRSTASSMRAASSRYVNRISASSRGAFPLSVRSTNPRPLDGSATRR